MKKKKSKFVFGRWIQAMSMLKNWAVQYLHGMRNDPQIKSALEDPRRFVVLTSSGQESNDCDGYQGTHIAYSEHGIVSRAEALEKRGTFAQYLLGGEAHYDYRELTDEERKSFMHERGRSG